MRRIAITGASGSGKTTLASRLARKLGLRHVEVDALHFGPNWKEATPDELRAKMRPLLEEERWVVDSLYRGKLGDMVPLAADTIVWIDLPLPITLARLMRRTLPRIFLRKQLWAGNRESFRGAFVGRESLFGWAIHRHAELRRSIPGLARELNKTLVHLRSQRAIDRFLADAGR